MKNTMLFCGAALMSIAMLQSCTKDELSNVNAVSGPQDMTFVAGTPSSRSSLQNGTTVWWTTGDAINIFSGQENNKFTTATGGSTVTTFTGKATPNNSYTALYPYNAEAVCLEGVVTTTLPSEQTAPAWGFDANANISYATATDNNKSLTFQNTCGLVKFKNNLTDLTGIKLTAGGDVKIAGNVKIDASANLTVESGSNVITLTAKEGTFVGPNEQNKNAKEYSMVVPPVTFTGGFTLELSKTSGNETYTFSGENLTITKGQIVTIELKEGGQPPVVEEQTTAIVASAQEIVTDPTTGNDRVVLTLDKDVAGTFTEAVKSAFKVSVAGVEIPVSSGTVSGKNITLTLGDKIYSNDEQITVIYNTDYAVGDLTTAENGKTANIKIESATVDLAHNTTWELNFADIAAAGDFYDPSTLEGVASTEDGILNVSAPTGGKKYISKEFKLRTTANYKFECEYVTAGNPALTVRFADPVATSNKDIFKVWIKDGVSPENLVSDYNVITAEGKWYMNSQGAGNVSDAPTVGKFSIEHANGGAQIKAIRLIETENRPDSKADASFNGTHGEYTNNNVTWTKQ
jgi:hypothetical protein